MPAHLLKDLSKKDLVLFESSHGSSLFRNMLHQFGNFCNYVRAHYVIGHDVIGHDVIGHPKVETDISGLDLSDVENRLAIHGLHKMLWIN